MSRPFSGVAGLADFPQARTHHEAVILYERDLLDALPLAYEAIHRAERRLAELDARFSTHALANSEDLTGRPSAIFRRRRIAASRQHAAEARDALTLRLQAARDALQALTNETSDVRAWLDGFVTAAEEYAAVRPQLRRQLAPPSMPSSARKYASIRDFLDENPARRLSDRHPREDMDATGADFGLDWTWQDPEAPWAITQWRVSYIDELRELYAYEIREPRSAPHISFDERPDGPRRVWLLASHLAREGEQGLFTNPTWAYLSSLECELMHQRNSLVLLAETLGITDERPDPRVR